jgi:hypothetical protein
MERASVDSGALAAAGEDAAVADASVDDANNRELDDLQNDQQDQSDDDDDEMNGNVIAEVVKFPEWNNMSATVIYETINPKEKAAKQATASWRQAMDKKLGTVCNQLLKLLVTVSVILILISYATWA